jgi:hypothetical protein
MLKTEGLSSIVYEKMLNGDRRHSNDNGFLKAFFAKFMPSQTIFCLILDVYH